MSVAPVPNTPAKSAFLGCEDRSTPQREHHDKIKYHPRNRLHMLDVYSLATMPCNHPCWVAKEFGRSATTILPVGRAFTVTASPYFSCENGESREATASDCQSGHSSGSLLSSERSRRLEGPEGLLPSPRRSQRASKKLLALRR